MGEKSNLRLATLTGWQPPAAAPSLDEARRALGGRTRSDGREGAGTVVQDPRHGRSDGVVICAQETELDVWIGDGLIARVRASAIGALTPTPVERLHGVALDVARYWRLREGDRVVVLGEVRQAGVLREQCRYGALVEWDASPGKVAAVGFRRLAPA